MFLKTINLINFRNYQELFLNIERPKLIILGDNSQGKTNLLEVVQIFSAGKSKRAGKDAQLVNFNAENAVIHAKILRENANDLNIAMMIRRSGRRTLKINEVNMKPKDINHKLYSVSFMVDDLNIVSGSPSSRRDWLDTILEQLYLPYGEILTKFEKALSQRNSFIKSCLEKDFFYNNLPLAFQEQLSIWDELFINAANELTKYRHELVTKISPLVEKYYQDIAGEALSLRLEYLGKVLSPEDLKADHKLDFIRACTSHGPQRDDINFMLKEQLASDFASQGEKRSIVLALKLTEIELLKEEHRLQPILLLDDVLAELDEARQDHLLEAISNDTQVIITTTHLGKHLQKWSENAQIINIKAGALVEYAKS
jgi:DNA replication and repair protein RecF